MRHMRHADRIRSGFAESADLLVDLCHIGPVDTALKSICHDAEILHGISKIRIVESSLLPRLCDKTCKAHALIPLCNTMDAFADILGKAFFAIGES